MYKEFNNYPESCPLSEVLRITMDNIKTFICDVAPNTDFNDTMSTSVPVPSISSLPDYIAETTPLIFYSDVVDNTDSAFIFSDDAEFKISKFADMNYPVYCIFYSWMPVPILIFVSKGTKPDDIVWRDRYSGSAKYYDGARPSYRQSICITFDISVFNLTQNDEIIDNALFTYCQRLVWYEEALSNWEDDLTYEGFTSRSSPILIFDPFYYQYFNIVADDSMSSVVHNFSFGMSLYNKTIIFYGIFNTGSESTSYVHTTLISRLDTQLIHGCDLISPEKSLICKSDAMAFLLETPKQFLREAEWEDEDSVEFKPHIAAYGYAVRAGDPYSYMPLPISMCILGAYADSNIVSGDCNLFHDNYIPNYASYRNFGQFNNVEKKRICLRFREKWSNKDPDKWLVNGKLWTNEVKVPTICLAIQSGFGRGDYLTLDYLSANEFKLPHFPTLTNGANISYPDFRRVDTDYNHNNDLLLSMTLNGDTEVFTRGFPTQTNNQLNDHFIAYPIHIYVKREPLDTNTYSLFCTLNFMFACQRLYDDDGRLHEYNYLDKKFIGISNRYTGLLYLVDDYKELIT